MDVAGIFGSIVGAAAVVGTPVGFVVRKVYETAERVATHEATILSINTSLTDLKAGQKAQSEKLDRLVERLL